jgi:hypothetical protein
MSSLYTDPTAKSPLEKVNGMIGLDLSKYLTAIAAVFGSKLEPVTLYVLSANVLEAPFTAMDKARTISTLLARPI